MTTVQKQTHTQPTSRNGTLGQKVTIPVNRNIGAEAANFIPQTNVSATSSTKVRISRSA